MELSIPLQLKKLMLGKGESGRQWLDALPQVIEKLEQDWGIEVEDVFENSYCNYVAKCKTLKGNNVVLKVSFPDKEFFRELEYLKLQKDGPVPKLLRIDESTPAVLLERISPAQTLENLKEDEAIKIAAGLMEQLWKVVDPPCGFRSVNDLYLDFLKLKGLVPMNTIFPREIVERANAAYLELQKNPHEKVLLHGDLHHFNIISDGQRGWVVIDPAGIIGEREYEPAAFLRNPPSFGLKQNLKDLLQHRIFTFAGLLDLDPKRMYLWAMFQTVLGAFWAVEDGADFQDSFVNVAKALAEMEIK